MQRKGNPLKLLVVMQAGTATLENSVEVPQKVKNWAALWPSHCTTYPKDTDVVNIRALCTPIPYVIAALSTTAKLWKELRCPSTDDWIKKMWSRSWDGRGVGDPFFSWYIESSWIGTRPSWTSTESAWDTGRYFWISTNEHLQCWVLRGMKWGAMKPCTDIGR